jgi:proliferating cell nuclear antigen|tara:strand:+ start:800 stop:1582 length:783 start_codon:yes stop_codon:yes gene_type:complete
MPSSEDYSLEIKTVQSSTIKVLIEALKEILTDTMVDITSEHIKICTMDSSHIILIHLKLDADKFEYFYCEGKKLIGVNILNLNKIIKTINNNDTLTLYMLRDDCNHLCIKIENAEKHTQRITKLNLLDLENTNFEIPTAVFQSVITLPANDFQKICRDVNNLSDFVEIKNVNRQLIISCVGDFCSQEIIISDSERIETDEPEEIFQGVFNAKYLVLFTKCTNLSNTVELYLKNDYPLIIQYTVGSLGTVKLCLAPQHDSE